MFPLISLGPITLPLPPLLLIVGFWIGTGIIDRKAKQSNIDPVFFEKLLWVTFFAGIIGGRLSFVARNPYAFKGNLISIISINPNLFDMTGGLFIVAVVGYMMISNTKYSSWEILDLLTPLFIVLLVFLGLSQFASGNGYGTTTSLPWGINLWDQTRHPVQLYYALADILIYIYIQINYKKNLSYSGRSFLLFLVLMSSSHLFISAFQEAQSVVAFGLHLRKILLWLMLTLSLILFLRHSKSDLEEKTVHA